MISRKFIIGITGGFGSGKSTAASFFELKGFEKIILSSFLEDEAEKRGFKKITRKILQDVGNEWRRKYGSGVLARRALEYLRKKKTNKAVIDGIRSLGEIEEFKKEKNFILIAVVSSKRRRFERLKDLKRREKLTWDIFQRLDRRDMGLGQKHTGLRVLDCVHKADIKINNNRGIEEFKNKLEIFLNSYDPSTLRSGSGRAGSGSY